MGTLEKHDLWVSVIFFLITMCHIITNLKHLSYIFYTFALTYYDGLSLNLYYKEKKINVFVFI